MASKGDGSYRATGRGYRAGATKSGKPDHDLVGVATARGGRREDVVRDVGDNAGAAV